MAERPIRVMVPGAGGWVGGVAPTVALSVAVALAAPARAEEGRRVFEARCASCHALSAAAPPMAGPQLSGLDGRRIGGDPAFDYSSALRNAEGAWDTARLEDFLTDPEEMFPGLWMGGNGIGEPAARRAVAEFLTSAGAPATPR